MSVNEMNKYLKNILFSDLSKWYVELYINRRTIDSKYQLVSLGKLITPSGILSRKEDYDNKIKIIDKIRFSDGKVFFREENVTNMNVYYSIKGELIASKINLHQGAIAINNFGTIACTTHYQPYQVNNNLIDIKYLLLVLRSDYFKAYLTSIKAKGIKNESGYDFIKSIKIPLPSIEEQKELLSRYNEKILLAELMKDEISYFNIERFIEKRIKLSETCSGASNTMLNFTNYASLNTWDVRNRSNKQIFQTSQYKLKPLRLVAEINPPLSKRLKDDDDVSFIPMECVSDLDGNIKEQRVCKANKKGFTKFENGDVIWAKITPCMQNGKSAVVYDLKNGVGYGSTEFYVIRTNKRVLMPEYLHYLLRMYRVREEAVNYFSGSAGQQRVRKSFLEQLNIPLPSLEEQNCIVKQLDEIKNQIVLNRDTIENLYKQANQDFENAIFTK